LPFTAKALRDKARLSRFSIAVFARITSLSRIIQLWRSMTTCLTMITFRMAGNLIRMARAHGRVSADRRRASCLDEHTREALFSPRPRTLGAKQKWKKTIGWPLLNGRIVWERL